MRGLSNDKAEPSRQCLWCTHFRNDGKFLEAAFAGLPSLGSGFASVRADDGICLRHDRYLSARSSCPDFFPAGMNRYEGAG